MSAGCGWLDMPCLFWQLMLYIRKHREDVSFGGVQILNHFIFELYVCMGS
jgi:hypothetical protein